jgi:copper(I)-binding protein
MSGCVTTRGITQMEHVARLDIPAGERVELAPGGYHVMLVGLTEPLEAGDVEVVVQVEAHGDDAAGHSH